MPADTGRATPSPAARGRTTGDAIPAAGRSSGQAPLGGPPGELVARGELELAQHRGHVALDGLDRDVQLAGDLLVGVALGDQPEDLALPAGQLVELGVEGRL